MSSSPDRAADALRPAAPPFRVGRIPYLNSAPYFLRWEEITARSEGLWLPSVSVPRLLGRAADAGTIDAGLFAEADLARLESSYEPLIAPEAGIPYGLGIANLDHVESVLLFLRSADSTTSHPRIGVAPPPPISEHGPGRLLTPLEVRRLSEARVALTEESSTSVRLLRILLTEKHGARGVRYSRGTDERSLAAADAALVIGDQALRWRRTPPAGFELVMDLAAEWHAWTGLPFTFARWGVHRSVPDSARLWLARFLLQSLESAVSLLGTSEAFAASTWALAASEFGPAEEIRAYLRLIRYRLGRDELRGAERFRLWLRQRDLLDPSF